MTHVESLDGSRTCGRGERRESAFDASHAVGKRRRIWGDLPFPAELCVDANPSGVSDPNPRFMFEVRVKDGQWYLDAFVNSKAGSKALIDPKKTHPLNQWYAVQQTYDGKTYRSYVNGVLENEAEVAFTPHGPGHMMVGVRINHVNYFQGSVAQARFTTHALKPEEFLMVPK